MKYLIILAATMMATSAFAVQGPVETLDNIQQNILPLIKSTNQFVLTKVPRINSVGRTIQNGTCTFSNSEISLSLEYCDMAKPQAQRLELKDLRDGSRFLVYLERNSATLLPSFRFEAADENGYCSFISFYGDPNCHDKQWVDEASNYKSYSSFNDASPETISFLMDFATRIEKIDRELRTVARK